MNRITELRAEKGKILDAMKAIADKVAVENRDLTAEEHTELDRLKADDDRLAKEIAQLEDVQRRLSAAAQPVPASPKPPAPRTAITDPKDKGLRLVRVLRAINACGNNIAAASQWVADTYGDGELAEAMATTPASVGGVFVQEQLAADFIELLRPASVVMRMNPRMIEMPSGNLSINRVATGTTASYVGERQPAPLTGMTFGQVKLAAKKLTSFVPVSNDLLRFASNGTDRMIRDDMVAGIAQRTDLAFIRGDGTQDTPMGLRNWAAQNAGSPVNVIAANGTINLANVRADIGKMELALRQTNRPAQAQGWLMSPRTESYLRNLADANGNFVYRAEMDRGLFSGKPFAVTTQIPENLGGGTDESELYLVEFSDVLVGEAMGLALAASGEASYEDSGTTKSAFQRDETLFRAIVQHDLGVRYLPSVVVLTTVKWTP